MTKHILVADDDQHILEIISFALGKAGMRVTLARDGRQALEAFATRTPDLMVLDINMPEMDGLVAAQEIRKLWPNGPRIIAITAYALKGDRERCLAAGMDDYISKPIVIEELRRVLEMDEERDEEGD